MCNPFWNTQTLEEARKLVHGPTDAKENAARLEILQTTGALIIHEMMHTATIANSPPEEDSKCSLTSFVPCKEY